MEEGDNAGRLQRNRMLPVEGTQGLEAESGSFQHLQTGTSVPLVNVRLAQESLLETERQRAAEAQLKLSSTILVLQEERDKAIQQFQDEVQRRAKQNKFSDTLLRDLDEMGKVLDHSRQATKQAKRQLIRKEAEVERLISEKRALYKLIIEAGPWALWDAVKKDIVEQGLQPGEDFERRWQTWLATGEDVKKTSLVSSMSDAKDNSDGSNLVAGNFQLLNAKEDQILHAGSDGKPSLLRILFSIFLQEGTVNLQYVLKKGLFFLPMAWFCFWMGLSSRVTWHVAGSISSSLSQSPLLFGFHIR